MERSHELAEDLGERVMKDLSVEGEMTLHTDPCHRIYCRMCDLDDCPIRREPFTRPPAADPGRGGSTRHAPRETMSEDLLERVRARARDNSFWRYLGVEVVEASEGGAPARAGAR